jgi:glutaredoxin
MSTEPTQKAIIHRMVLPEHECPYGRKALELLESHGFEVEDHQLKSRAEVDAFKVEQGVTTTPLIFIDGERVGGHSDLVKHLSS